MTKAHGADLIYLRVLREQRHASTATVGERTFATSDPPVYTSQQPNHVSAVPGAVPPCPDILWR